MLAGAVLRMLLISAHNSLLLGTINNGSAIGTCCYVAGSATGVYGLDGLTENAAEVALGVFQGFTAGGEFPAEAGSTRRLLGVLVYW